MERVLLKLSGEALAGEAKKGLDHDTVVKVARQVKGIVDAGIRVGIVIGGGNFWRGDEHEAEIERTKGDQIGMLATVMNCLYVSETFRKEGIPTCVVTPFVLGAFTHLYAKDLVMNALGKGEVVIVVKIRRSVDHSAHDQVVFRVDLPLSQLGGDDLKAAAFDVHGFHV